MAAQSLSKPPYETQVIDQKSNFFRFSWIQWFQSVFFSINQLDSGINQGRQL